MRVIGMAGVVILVSMTFLGAAPSPKLSKNKKHEILVKAEKFGLVIDEVTEDMRQELNLRSAEGIAVLEVIGESCAYEAGIKVHAIIVEIDKKPVRNLNDFDRFLGEALTLGNFTIATWEPPNQDDMSEAQPLNFHFVAKRENGKESCI
jgi:S1-C subfamily serine protease